MHLAKARSPRVEMIVVGKSTTSRLAERASAAFAKVVESLGRRRPITWRELLVAAAALLTVGAIVLAGHVAHGSLSYDDWALSADQKYQGYWAVVSFYLHIDHRPLLALYLPLVPAALGDTAEAQLAWIAFAHLAMCFCVYVFLRTLALERVHGGLVALLVLVFPFADSAWLYVIGSAGTVAVSLYLLGSVAALHGLHAERRRSWFLHGLAVLLYVASVLTYELVLVAILLSGLLYLGRGSRRAVATRWIVDIAAMVVTVLLATSRAVPLLPGQDVHAVLPLAQQISHAELIIHQGRDVLASSLFPLGTPRSTVVLVAALVVTVGAVAVAVGGVARAGDQTRAELQRWLVIELLALVGVITAWLVLVPADPYYSPAQPGVGNRINAFAGVCICVLVYALAMLLVRLLLSGLPRRQALVTCLSAVVGGAIALGYIHRVDVDKGRWRVASSLQSRELATLRRALPAPAPGTRMVLFDAPGYAAPGVPIFAAPWDLNGAVQLRWHDRFLAAYPVLDGTQIVCGSSALVPTGGGYAPYQQAPYGTAFFVDARTGEVLRIDTRAECARALRQFPPGPLQL